jgi:DNA (cytosine-5)-methyltransferase 1
LTHEKKERPLNYYNEIEPYPAEWLRNLIRDGLIPPGDVDERDIREIKGSDLKGYTQCHFFAGLGGWAYALELAGWPATEPVWTGSCPCQPFSVSGKRLGSQDERHLWPDFRNLIEVCRPATVFGEQVASADGRVWLSGVRADLEELGYGVGAADMCAAGIGAPHIRQRLWWVADGSGGGRGGKHRRGPGREPPDGMGDTIRPGSQGRSGDSGEYADQRTPWATGESIPCLDGKSRRIEPGILPLAHGVPARVGKIRAYGNAIVPQVAAEFIAAFMEIN